jgi:hypothetical protein
MVSSLLLASVAGLCLPLPGGPVWLIVGLLAAQQLCGDGAATVYEIAAVSLRQAVTLDRLQGRVHATFQVIAGAAQLTGLLAGGALGSTIGLRLTLGLGVGGTAFAALWLLASPVRSLHAYPPTASSSTRARSAASANGARVRVCGYRGCSRHSYATGPFVCSCIAIHLHSGPAVRRSGPGERAPHAAIAPQRHHLRRCGIVLGCAPSGGRRLCRGCARPACCGGMERHSWGVASRPRRARQVPPTAVRVRRTRRQDAHLR